MSKKKYKVTFLAQCLEDDGFKSQLQRVEVIYSAQCSICCKMFDISDMSESALTSHMKGKKLCEQVPTISGSQSSCFSESKSIDLSAPSESSNNHLSAHSISNMSKS